MMRVLIVEDETAAAENLEYLLRKVDPDIEVATNTESVEQTARWLSENTVDLIFMDIHLSDGSAFSLFDSVDVKTPIILQLLTTSMRLTHSKSTALIIC